MMKKIHHRATENTEGGVKVGVEKSFGLWSLVLGL